MKHWKTPSGIAAAAILALATVAASTNNAGAGTASAVRLLPDIVEEVPHHLQIQNTQQREFLRFSTTHINSDGVPPSGP